MKKNEYISARDAEQLMTKAELAKRLRRSTRTIEIWSNEGRIPKIKVAHAVYYSWPDVVSAMKQGGVK